MSDTPLVDNLTDDELIERMFHARFKAWEYPREGANRVLKQMSPEMQQVYFENAAKLLNNEVLSLELKETTRRMFTDLALNEGTVLDRQARRLALVWVDNFQKRLVELRGMIKKGESVGVSNMLDK